MPDQGDLHRAVREAVPREWEVVPDRHPADGPRGVKVLQLDGPDWLDITWRGDGYGVRYGSGDTYLERAGEHADPEAVADAAASLIREYGEGARREPLYDFGGDITGGL